MYQIKEIRYDNILSKQHKDIVRTTDFCFHSCGGEEVEIFTLHEGQLKKVFRYAPIESSNLGTRVEESTITYEGTFPVTIRVTGIKKKYKLYYSGKRKLLKEERIDKQFRFNKESFMYE